MTKKILLPVGIALALVAFAVPAVAQADIEFTNVPGNGEVTVSGEVTSDFGGVFSTGPAEVTLTFEAVTGTGAVVDGGHASPVSGTHIATNLPGCGASMAIPVQGAVILETPDILKITDFTISYTYTGPNCAAFSVPHKISVDGTVTAAVNGSCLFLGSPQEVGPEDDLFIETGEGTLPEFPVDLTGELCLNGGVAID